MIGSKFLFVARTITASLLTAAISHSAQAAFVPSQIPLNLGGQVEPNLTFILDDSGSMRWGFLPDDLKPSYLERSDDWYERKECAGRGTYAGKNLHFCPKTGLRYLASSHLNKSYYNPAVQYLPPIKSDGQRYANASFAAAYVDGYAGGTTVNLGNDYLAIMDDYFSPNSYECLNKRCSKVEYYNGFAVGAESGGVAAFYYEYVGGGSCASNPRQDACYAERSVGTAERQNFANWFSYYRNRMMSAKAGVSQAFSGLPGDIRVGYGAINVTGQTVDSSSTDTLVRGVRRFEGSGRSEFYDWLFSASASGGTPLRRALGDAGEYYSRTGSGGPWSSTPGQSGGKEYSCRQSYTILTTDGYWNNDAASKPAARANVDNTNGPAISGPDGQSYRYVPKAPFNDSQANTLADVAMYYWSRDLHPDLANRVPTDPADPALWQHMVTFGVGLGVSGTIDPQAAFTAARNGGAISWPDPADSDPAKLDDLLHAAVNGRGGFYSAQDPQQFASALGDTLASIADRTGSNTAAVPNARRLDGNTLVYEAYYSSADWSGKLLAKRPKRTSAGVVFEEMWEAGRTLGTGSRNLFTHDGSAGRNHGLALNWGALPTGLKTHFNDSEALFTYLMGSRENEAPAGLKFRKRSTLLGDIVNSTLVLANRQDWGFHGRVPVPANEQTYAQFVAAKSSRAPVLFVGANDGFLHALNANTGNELFAYMPNGVLGNVKTLANSDYKHRYFVDGKLHIRDARLNDQWRTVLLGSLGAGGKSVFALDVTDASQSGFSATNVLWEISNDADLGYNFGEPLIGRMKDGSWAAIFGNGHGSTSDDAVLFIVDLATGAVNKVRAGSATGGLSSPSFVYAVDGSGNIYVKDVYAGDLSGNLWKFNLKDNGDGSDDFEVSLKSGNTPQPLYVATDAQGNRQPISVKPEIAYHPDGVSQGVIVYFGTGRLYTAGDVAEQGTQTVYGIWDKKASSGSSIAFSGRTALEGRSILFEGEAFSRNVRVLDAPTSAIDWSRKRGWYLDLTSPVHGAQGERMIFAPRILLNRLVVETAIPSADPCLAGGSGWTMVLDMATGGRLNYVLLDLNKDGKFTEADMVSNDGTKLPPSGIGSSGSIPTGSYDLIDPQKYWLCRGTGVDDCIPAANTLDILEGRQSWNQIR
ncbi:PilC/PilY family type IV pilus protein [Pseudomonas sp. LFM046]|uniref:pilus assembly protein n=1 Tax=Pseudomonas sp. LFM046 TaxID=1608357 RepID=UPI001304D30D|nr:PilC/PilY family type IV pilus protein [Pseudomonas sp. LFM046]